MGRYGYDQLSFVLLIFSFCLVLLGQVIGLRELAYIGYVPLLLCVYRTFSKKLAKRRQENNQFLKVFHPIWLFFVRSWNHLHGRKHYRYFRCPQCKKKLRVPKGKGTLRITCPNCRMQLIKKT